MQKALKIIPARHRGFKKKNLRLFMFSSYNEILSTEGIGLCPWWHYRSTITFCGQIQHYLSFTCYVYPLTSSNRQPQMLVFKPKTVTMLHQIKPLPLELVDCPVPQNFLPQKVCVCEVQCQRKCLQLSQCPRSFRRNRILSADLKRSINTRSCILTYTGSLLQLRTCKTEYKL